MSDGRKAAYEDEMEEWMNWRVKEFQKKDTSRVVQDLRKVLTLLDEFRNTDPVLTEANHWRVSSIRNIIEELLY